MRIGIIGAGEMGSTLIRQYTAAGHAVKMANASGPEKLKSIASETGALAVTLSRVVLDADVIVISIPMIGILKLPKELFRNIPDTIPIIDTCNYYPIVSGPIQEIEEGMHESVWVSSHIGRPVTKAYNTIFYRSLVHSGLPSGHRPRVALPIAGDERRSKELVASLINDSGFDCFDQGNLQDSWRQEPGSPVYCTDLTLTQVESSIHKAKKEILAARRELGLKQIMDFGPEQWRGLVDINRRLYESELN